MSNRFNVFSDDSDNKKPAAPAAPAKAAAPAAPAAPAKVGGAAASTKPRGPRGAQANTGSRPPRREFDRQSGTGRGREVRKNGAGKFGWGNDKDPKAATGEVPAVKPEDGAAPANPEGAAPAAGDAPAPAPEKKEPEEPPVFTFADSIKAKEAKAVQGDKKPPRRIQSNGLKGKTINSGAAANAAAPAAPAASTSTSTTAATAAPKKQTLNLYEFNTAAFTPASSGRSYERDDHRRRGGLNVKDESAFPKLG